MRGLSTLALVLCCCVAPLCGQAEVTFQILDPDEISKSAEGRVLVTRGTLEGPVFIGAVAITAGESATRISLDAGTYDLELALKDRSMHVEALEIEKGGPAKLTVPLFEPAPGVLLTGVIERAPGEPVSAGSRFVLDLRREGAPFAAARWQHSEVEVMCDAAGRFMYGLPAPSDSLERMREFRTWLSVRMRPIDADPPEERDERLRGYRSLTTSSTWDFGVLALDGLAEPPAMKATLQDHEGRFILGLDVEVEYVPTLPTDPGWLWTGTAVTEPAVELEGFPMHLGEVRLDVVWGGRRWTMKSSAGVNPLLIAPPPQVHVMGKVRPPLKRMLDARMRILLVQRGQHRYRHSTVVQPDDGRFEIPDVDEGEYDVLVENAWGEPASCGTVKVQSEVRAQSVGTLEFRGWRMLMIHEERTRNRILGVARGRRGFGRLRFLKDGQRVPTRWEVNLLMDEIAPGHVRMAVPPETDLERWGIEVTIGGKVVRHPKLSKLIGTVPQVTVVMDRFADHLGDEELHVVLVLRREDMTWADGIRKVLEQQVIKDGKWPQVDVFPGEWLVGIEIRHTGHGGMQLIELGTVEAGVEGEETRHIPGLRKLGEVIEAVNRLKEK